MNKRFILSVVLSSLLLVAISFLAILSPANAMEDHAIPVTMGRFDPVLAQVGNYNGKYAGQFTNQSINASGSVVLSINIASSAVSGYINFTNNPGSGPLCGAGNFNGTRNSDTIQFSFTSSDSDPGCTWANGLVFTVSGVLSGNQIVNGTYTVSDGEKGIFSAMQTTSYTGRFITLKNRVGSVSIDLASSTTMVAGFVNFTNDPGAAALCGSGSFVGTRNGDSIQFSFLSNDPDAGCTFDKGLIFNISGTVSGNQLSASYAIPSISEGGNLSATAPSPSLYAVSGRIIDGSGNALIGVTVSDGTRSITTDSSGNYTLSNVPVGSYTLIPSLNSYSFSPVSRSVSVSGNVTGQDFTATLIPATYSVSGRVITSSSVGVSGVTISDGTRTAMTDSNGNYTLSGVPAGSYTLISSLNSYSFSPVSRNVSVSGNVTGQDFTATLIAVGGTWTFMLYLDGDTRLLDNGLVYASLGDAIQRLENNPNARVRIVALIDGPGNLDTFRVTFTPQAQYQTLGEKRMDDPVTLSEFVQQARQEFPADHYYLAIADHANGIQGIAWDTTTASNSTALLTPGKLRQALNTITNNGTQPLDVVHFDGCSFGMLEDAAMTRGFARYVVASENIGWGVFAYDRYRAAIGSTTTPADFARSITESYAQAVGQYPYTISAMDMSRFDTVLSGLNHFADQLTTFANRTQANRDVLVSLRTQSQKFDSGGLPYLEINNDDVYIDLVDFAARAKQQVTSDNVPAAADELIAAINGNQPFVVAETHRSGTFYLGESYSWTLDGAHGVSIYYPPRSAGTAFGDYISGVTFPEFTSLNRWKNYLQAGAPPLAPGDPLPNEVLEPLAPLPLPSHNVYLPMIFR